MPKLVSAAIISSTIPKPVSEISNETLQILEKETVAPKPVSKHVTRGNEVLCIFQIKVRHKGKENESNVANTSRSEPSPTEITAGTYVACYLQKYCDEEPQLSKVVCIDGEQLEVEWLVGSYSEPWTVWKEKRGREYVTWKELIPMHAVLFPVSLTKTQRLPSSLILKLKTLYEQKRTM